MHAAASPSRWLVPTDEGLYCVPGDFHVDPSRAVARAVITHAHADHARAGHGAVLATPETVALMRARYGGDAARSFQPLQPGETLRHGDADIRLAPAGHVLGSAQVVIEHGGGRAVVSGDYKREPDPTCVPFEPVPCDLFVTEATFGLPVFRHPPVEGEIARLLDSLRLFPDRAHVVGVYALGKCQRLIALLRQAGYDEPVYLHGALAKLCNVYADLGIDLGPLESAAVDRKDRFASAVVLAPPSAIRDRWARRLSDPVVAAASGWMRVKQRAKQRGVELPLVISDHADWDALVATIEETGAAEVWVTHGQEDALVHHVTGQGRRARALSLVGYDEDEESVA